MCMIEKKPNYRWSRGMMGSRTWTEYGILLSQTGTHFLQSKNNVKNFTKHRIWILWSMTQSVSGITEIFELASHRFLTIEPDRGVLTSRDFIPMTYFSLCFVQVFTHGLCIFNPVTTILSLTEKDFRISFTQERSKKRSKN